MASLFSSSDGFQNKCTSFHRDQTSTCQVSAAKALRTIATRNVIKGLSTIVRSSRNDVAISEDQVKNQPWSFEKQVLEELVTNLDRQPSSPHSATSSDGNTSGLGIVQSLKNKRLLVTGATGFLGKVLVEKILRAQPDVGKIYLLINAENTAKAKQRLTKDVQNSVLFKELRRKHGSNFNNFLQEKLVALPGRIEKGDLGLDTQTRKELSGNLDIIVNSAATTNFTERYDVALDINTKGPLNLLNFAKECPHIQLFVHVSTAFVNGTRKGLVKESPFAFGQSITQEMFGEESAPHLDVWKEIESVKKNSATSEGMKTLGMERAKLHGWQDTYVFTKAMGEMLLNQARGEIPVVILRPSVVESTISQPCKGWIQGTRMMDPILLSFGRGHIEAFYADPNGVLDVVPADMVVNTLLAAMAHHLVQNKGLNVYQIGSSAINPLRFQELAEYAVDHFKAEPFHDKKGDAIIPPQPFSFHTSRLSFALHSFFKYWLPVELAKLWGDKDLRRHAKMTALLGERLEQLLLTYSAYTFYEGRFDITNTKCLYEKMTPEEKREFAFDIWSVDWREYIINIHLPGLRKHNLRDGNSTFSPINMKEYIQGVLASAIS